MNGYPVLLNIYGWRCLIVGGGKVACRKAHDLLDCGAEIIVISPALSPMLYESFLAGFVIWHQTSYSIGQVTALRPQLVIAATTDPEINAVVAREAREIGVLVNCVDDSAPSDFSNMVTLRRPPITIALATGGTSPALAVHLKEELARAVGDEYATLAQWLGELRPTIQASIPDQAARHDLFQSILDSDVLYYLRQGDEQTARVIIAALVGQSL